MVSIPCAPPLIAPIPAVFAANFYVTLLPRFIAKAGPPFAVIGHIKRVVRNPVSRLPGAPIFRKHPGDIVGTCLSRLFEDDGNSRRLTRNMGDPHGLEVNVRRLPLSAGRRPSIEKRIPPIVFHKPVIFATRHAASFRLAANTLLYLDRVYPNYPARQPRKRHRLHTASKNAMHYNNRHKPQAIGAP